MSDSVKEQASPEQTAPDTTKSQEIVITSHPYEGPMGPDANYRRKFTSGYWFGRNLVMGIMKVTCGYRFEGAENVPYQGAAILACNHQALLDPPFIATVIKQRQVHFIAKTELQHIPVVGAIVRRCGCVWVDRKARDGKALNGALNVLEENKLLGIFPEGTRSKTGKLLPAHTGVAVLALKTGAPVIPSAVFNTRAIMGNSSKLLLGKGPAGMRIGKPIYFDRDENPSRERLREVRDEIMHRISELMEQGMP